MSSDYLLALEDGSAYESNCVVVSGGMHCVA